MAPSWTWQARLWRNVASVDSLCILDGSNLLDSLCKLDWSVSVSQRREVHHQSELLDVCLQAARTQRISMGTRYMSLIAS